MAVKYPLDKVTKEYLEYLQGLRDDQQTEIDRELLNAYSEAEDIMGASQVSNFVDDVLAFSSFSFLYATLSNKIGNILTDYQVKTIKLSGDYSKSLLDFKNVLTPKRESKIDSKIDEFASDYQTNFLNKVFPTDPRTVGQRIKTIQDWALYSTRNIIATGIDDGKSASQMAKDIQNFIKKDPKKQWVSPFEWYRKAFGLAQDAKPIRNNRVGSIDYQYIRIARTEINNTWRNITIRVNNGESYLEGFVWRLSDQHPEYDICDELAKGSPYKSLRYVPKTPHPNCLCTVVPLIKQ